MRGLWTSVPFPCQIMTHKKVGEIKIGRNNAVLSFSQCKGIYSMFSIIQRMSFVRTPPRSRSPGVQVTSVELSTDPSPINTPQIPALTFSFQQNTHIILHSTVCVHCNALQFTGCMHVHGAILVRLCVCEWDELSESHLWQQQDEVDEHLVLQLPLRQP